MNKDQDKPKRVMPKGGRKGGRIFPRISLADAVEYGKKCVSKTHVAPQTIESIFVVVGAGAGMGDIRVSALKQYGFLVGDRKVMFSSLPLAQQIATADAASLPPLLRTACLNPKVFKGMFETYHGELVSKSKMRQGAMTLGVHPDEHETCVQLFVDSAVFAGLATLVGEQVQFSPQAAVPIEPPKSGIVEDEQDLPSEAVEDDEDNREANHSDAESRGGAEPSTGQGRQLDPGSYRLKEGPNVTLNITVDSMTDPDKLAKQLDLLRRFLGPSTS